MMGYIKIAAGAALVLIGAWFAWTIAGWKHEAGKVPNLEASLKDERDKYKALKDFTVRIDNERNEADAKLSAREAVNAKTIQNLKRQIANAVPREPRCDYSADARQLLVTAISGDPGDVPGSTVPAR